MPRVFSSARIFIYQNPVSLIEKDEYGSPHHKVIQVRTHQSRRAGTLVLLVFNPVVLVPNTNPVRFLFNSLDEYM